MPKLKKLRLQSPWEGVNIFRREDGTILIRKSGLTSARVKTDPAFAVTLANALAFGVAAAWAARVSRALKSTLEKYRIKGSHKRLLGRLVTGLSAARSATHEMAQSLIPGFECNRFSFSQKTVHNLFRITYSSDNQTITAVLPPLLPAVDINFPIGATHCKLSLLLTLVCWKPGIQYIRLHEDDTFYRINHVPSNQIEITLKQPDYGTWFVLAAVGIQYFMTSIDEQELYNFCNVRFNTFDILSCRLLSPPPNN